MSSSNFEMSVGERGFEHLATAQKQLVIKKSANNIVNVDSFSWRIYSKPSSSVMCELVCG